MDYVMAFIVLEGGAAVQRLNKPMACATRLLPHLLVIQLYLVAAYTSHDYAHGHGNATAASCHPDQAAALLQLKKSFIFDYSTTTLPSWQPGTDCCLWEGVGCDGDVSGVGQVTVLDLGGCGLYSYGCHAALFNLTSLRYLDLSMNDFGGSRIPEAGFERLSKLTHLNLSYSDFYGQIPIAIGKLTTLVTLDLSRKHSIDVSYTIPIHYALSGFYNYLLLREPSFETLVANLTNLRELHLDGVDISSSGEEWCSGLGKAVPHLEVLSMSNCQLHGPISSSLASLQSLTVINLEYNGGISGVFPEFFANYLKLILLQLSYTDFSGWFPQKIFQLKNIRVLDVSGNYQLSGHLPEFPNGTALETLNLKYTNFSSIKLSSFSNFLSLKGLGIDGRSISMEPTDLLLSQLNSLQNLQLSSADYLGELGPLFSWISNLKDLIGLTLEGYRSSKMIPPSIGNLTNLKSLEIANCDFFGQIPPSVGNLTKLTSLRISGCAFSGTIPSSIGNLKKLRSLEISFSDLSGPITTDIGHLSRLTVLVLAGCRFSGRIPSTIVNLTRLIYVDLAGNELQGEIPTSLFSSQAMLLLDLSSNQLSGQIEEFDTQYSRMRMVSLGTNQITGQIPASFFQIKSLVYMDLMSNNLTGLVQLSSFWKLRKLSVLELSNNRLSILDGEGSKPTMPLLCKILVLRLGSCNMTTIPRFLMHVNYIVYLDLSSNKIQGTIPQWIWETWDDSLTMINLSNNIFTDMQLTSYVLPNSCLQSVDLSFNRIQGQIPIPNMLTSGRKNTQVLDYSNNRFSSVMSNFSAYLGNTAYIKLSKNNISGNIPHSICDLSNLQVLDLSYNNFSGAIPSCLIEDSSLGILSLRENNFEGTLPYNVSKDCNLQVIDLHGNKIEGQLPRSLSNCADLEVLDIGNNQMVDTFPSWLGRLSDLCVLVLRTNQFYGSLASPPRDSKFGKYFSKLQIIDIASNNFSGNLDPQWFEKFKYMMGNFSDTGKILHYGMWFASYYHDTVAITYKGQYKTIEKILIALTVIDFSNNALEGDIPESIGRLVSLHILNMSHNAFTGIIPPQIGEMSQLESLDLSSNMLSGDIPQELTDLTFLGTLNLRENNLDGRIPQSHQFATFENTSYEGNPGLCGPPLSKPCGDLSDRNEAQINISGDHVDIILFLFIGVGFGVGFTAGILMKMG